MPGCEATGLSNSNSLRRLSYKTSLYENVVSFSGSFKMLSQNLFLHHNISLVIEFTFMPKGTMRQMVLTSSWAHSQIFSKSLVVCSSFVSSGFRGFSFRIWHNLNIYFSFFNFSHRGSISSPSFSFSGDEE